MVQTQAQTMRPANPQRTAIGRRELHNTTPRPVHGRVIYCASINHIPLRMEALAYTQIQALLGEFLTANVSMPFVLFMVEGVLLYCL